MELELILQLLCIVVTTALGYIAILSDKPFTKSKKRYSIFAIILLTVAFAGSGLIAKKQYEKERESFADEEKEREKAALRARSTMAKIDVTLNEIKAVQRAANVILDSTKEQLAKQDESNLISMELIRKNEKLLRAQLEVFDNTERALNPIFPMNANITVSIPFNGKIGSQAHEQRGFERFEKTISQIRDYLDANPDKTVRGIESFRNPRTKMVIAIFIKDIDSLSAEQYKTTDGLFDRYHQVVITRRDHKGKKMVKTAELNFSLAHNVGHIATPCEKTKNSITVLYAQKLYLLTTDYYRCSSPVSFFYSSRVFGMNDLPFCSIGVQSFYKDMHLVDIGLYPIKGNNQNCLIEFDSRHADSSIVDPKDKGYFRKIEKWDLNRSKPSPKSYFLQYNWIKKPSKQI